MEIKIQINYSLQRMCELHCLNQQVNLVDSVSCIRRLTPFVSWSENLRDALLCVPPPVIEVRSRQMLGCWGASRVYPAFLRLLRFLRVVSRKITM